MYELTISVPDEIALALKTKPEQLGDELRLAAAVKLYELGKLSSGAAANLAGIPRVLFLSKLAEYGVNTFQLSEEELTEDLANAVVKPKKLSDFYGILPATQAYLGKEKIREVVANSLAQNILSENS